MKKPAKKFEKSKTDKERKGSKEGSKREEMMDRKQMAKMHGGKKGKC